MAWCGFAQRNLHKKKKHTGQPGPGWQTDWGNPRRQLVGMTTSSMYVAERRRVWRERADVADDCPNLVDACRVPTWFSVVSVNRIVNCMKSATGG